MIRNRKGGLKQVLRSSKTCPFHPDRAAYTRGLCKSCYHKWLIKNNPEYARHQHENCRKWLKAHSKEKREQDKLWRAKKDPEWRWQQSLRGSYGITPDDYEKLLTQQGGVCAICGKPPTKKRLHIDHNHETGVIRGLLCFRCNFGLTYFSENADTMLKAHQYLKNGEVNGREFMDALEQRETQRKKESKSQEAKLLAAHTKEIAPDEKEAIRRKRIAGEGISDIMTAFPQYSRSALRRAMTGETHG